METYSDYNDEIIEYLQDNIKQGYTVLSITSYGTSNDIMFSVNYYVRDEKNCKDYNANAKVPIEKVKYYRLRKRIEKISKLKERINNGNIKRYYN